jgi:hypothetical protein
MICMPPEQDGGSLATNDTKRAALESAALPRSSHTSQGWMSGREGVTGVAGGVSGGVVTTGAGPDS